jgi:hypothetical protein
MENQETMTDSQRLLARFKEAIKSEGGDNKKDSIKHFKWDIPHLPKRYPIKEAKDGLSERDGREGKIILDYLLQHYIGVALVKYTMVAEKYNYPGRGRCLEWLLPNLIDNAQIYADQYTELMDIAFTDEYKK